MKSFNLLIKKSIWAVAVSVAMVVVPTTTVHAISAYLGYAQAELTVQTDGGSLGFFCCEQGSGFPPDGAFNLNFPAVPTPTALALSSTDFDPLGASVATPLAIFGADGVGVGVSASVFGIAAPDGLAASIAGSKGTFSIMNLSREPIDLTITLDAEFLIAGGSIVDEGPGTFEAALAAVALGVFVEDELAISRFTFDVAHGDDDGFIDFGSRTWTRERTLRGGQSVNLGVGVLAAGATISKQKNVIPEPTTILLLGTGLVGIGIWRMRKEQSKNS